jgi:putative two-component system response regulator
MKILIADDIPENLDLLETLLITEGHEVIRRDDGRAALKAFEQDDNIDLALLDVMMPGLTGYELTKKIKERKPIPVILLTGLKKEEDIIKGLECGADEFLNKPFVREELVLRIRNILQLKEYQNDLETTVQKRTGQLSEALRNSSALNREMIYRLLAAAECRNDASAKHIIRIGKYSRITARNLGFNGELIAIVEDAASMHDIGKIGIPDKILLKPGKLTIDEFEVIKSHTTIGAAILEDSEFPLLNMSYEIAFTHHERWDGTGYPAGLKGNDIPIIGRVVALADVFDALTSRRPYKPAYTWEKSLEIIQEESGTHFDPAVVSAFLTGLKDIKQIYEDFYDTDVKFVQKNISDFDVRR